MREFEQQLDEATRGIFVRKWRTGKKLGRTIYYEDRVVGIVDTPELAKLLVDAANDLGARLR
jgi:hypothetical protein